MAREGRGVTYWGNFSFGTGAGQSGTGRFSPGSLRLPQPSMLALTQPRRQLRAASGTARVYRLGPLPTSIKRRMLLFSECDDDAAVTNCAGRATGALARARSLVFKRSHERSLQTFYRSTCSTKLHPTLACFLILTISLRHVPYPLDGRTKL